MRNKNKSIQAVIPIKPDKVAEFYLAIYNIKWEYKRI